MQSIWSNRLHRPSFEPLSGDIKTDVLIIGGGMAGLLCAYELKAAGIDCAVAESNMICGGVSANTTAKITCQHGAIYNKMLRRFGHSTVALYIKAQMNALERYRSLCSNIDCDFRTADSYVYSLDNRQKMEREAAALRATDCCATFEQKLPLPFSVAGAVCVKNQAQFNPLKFAFSIANGLQIYENTRVTELEPDCAITHLGRIYAQKIIVATHFPFINKHGLYFMKMYQHRSYVIALKNAADVKGMYVDEDEKGLSFRNYDRLLLLGGGGHRTGKKGGGYNQLREFVAAHYPSAKVVGRWATQDCRTLDDIAYIGQYSPSTPNLYVATGFNKWGMTSSMVAAQLLCCLVSGRQNEFVKVFSPSRSILRPQLAVNAAETALNFLTPTAPRCSHMGCALKYNPIEHSWDCPCHGSRFSDDGGLLDNPATENKSFTN